MEGDVTIVSADRDVPRRSTVLSLLQRHQVEVPLSCRGVPSSLQGALLLRAAQGHVARAQWVWKRSGSHASGLWGALEPHPSTHCLCCSQDCQHKGVVYSSSPVLPCSVKGDRLPSKSLRSPHTPLSPVPCFLICRVTPSLRHPFGAFCLHSPEQPFLVQQSPDEAGSSAEKFLKVFLLSILVPS